MSASTWSRRALAQISCCLVFVEFRRCDGASLPNEDQDEDFDVYSIDYHSYVVSSTSFDEYWDEMVALVKEHASGTTVDLATA